MVRAATVAMSLAFCTDSSRISAPSAKALAWRAQSPIAKQWGRLVRPCASISTSLPPVAPASSNGATPGSMRVEERAVGKEGGSPCKYRWTPSNDKENGKKSTVRLDTIEQRHLI